MTTDTNAASVQYSWSIDQETFRDQCDSVAAAIAAAVDHHGGDLRVGSTVYIGDVVQVETEALIDASSIVEAMQERAYEDAGEASEDYLAVVSAEQLKELQHLVADWADRVETVNFWRVGNIASHVISAEDLGETCEAGQPECGPVTNHDSEGVPLCAVCWEGLLADSQDGQPDAAAGVGA